MELKLGSLCLYIVCLFPQNQSASGFMMSPAIFSRKSLKVTCLEAYNSVSKTTFSNNNDNNDDDDIDEEDEDCNIKGLFGSKKNIYLISDRMGNLAKTALQSSLAQFDFCDDRYTYDLIRDSSNPILENSSEEDKKPCNVHTHIFTFVQDLDTLKDILQSASKNNAMVLFTMSDPKLRQIILNDCTTNDLQVVDFLGPTLSNLTNFLGRPPTKSIPSKKSETQKNRQGLSEKYYRRIEAVEYTLQADDGQSPWLLQDADIVLVGVSRTGKTPLSVLLSQTQGFKVANVPLVLECPSPIELNDIDPHRVFCLTISPTELKRIRRTRLERNQIPTTTQVYTNVQQQTSNYGDRAYVLQDLKNARTMTEDKGWTEVDVTGRAVEESASYICELMNERFGERNLYL